MNHADSSSDLPSRKGLQNHIRIGESAAIMIQNLKLGAVTSRLMSLFVLSTCLFEPINLELSVCHTGIFMLDGHILYVCMEAFRGFAIVKCKWHFSLVINATRSYGALSRVSGTSKLPDQPLNNSGECASVRYSAPYKMFFACSMKLP